MMISYSLEQITPAFVAEVTPIFEAHREELQSWDMPLKPNWEAYKTMEKNDSLYNIVARDKDETIVGYSVFFVTYNMHYSDFLFATEDIFYVVQDKRGSRIAFELIKRSEEMFKELGVNVITHHAKKTNKFASFLEKFGYKQVEVVLAKRLDI